METTPAPLPVLALAVFAANLGLGIVFPLIPHLAAGSVGGTAAVGGIFASYAAALVPAEVVGGALADRLDAARLLPRALGLYMVTLLLFTVARDLPTLMAVRALEGLAIGFVMPAVMKLVVQAAPPGQLGRAMGTVMGLGGIGFILGPLLGSWLAPYGLVVPFVGAAAIAGLAASATAMIKPGTGEGGASAREIARVELAAFGRRLADLGFWGLVLPLVAVKAVFATLQAALPIFGERVLGADLAHVSYLFVITAVAYGLAQPLAGRLADRYPTRFLIAADFVLLVALLPILASQQSYLAFLPGFAVFSLAQCSGVLFALKLIGEGLGEAAKGRALGLASALGDIGMIAAPALLLPAFGWRQEAPFWGLGLAGGGLPGRHADAGKPETRIPGPSRASASPTLGKPQPSPCRRRAPSGPCRARMVSSTS